jgi:hypothetical protein
VKPKFNYKMVLALAVLGLIVFFAYEIHTGKIDLANLIPKSGTQDEVTDYVGSIESLTIHDGLSNASTSEDSVNSDMDVMSVLSADATMVDGEEYAFNLTIGRSEVAYAGKVYVECSAPDKELDGVTALNLVEKTAGKIDLDFVGMDDNTGTHTGGGESVKTAVTFAAGTSTKNIEVKFDQEETYHDGMTDLQDSFEVVCEVSKSSDMSNPKSVEWSMKANS